MSRFDSPVQVVGLFLVASLVSIALIFLINAETEAERRRDKGLATAAGGADEGLTIREAKYESKKDESFISIDSQPYTQNMKAHTHTPLLNYLESGIGRLFGLRPRVREKRSLRDTDASKRRRGGNSGDANFERLVQESSVKMSFSSDAHKIRHARKKLDEKGLDGVLRMIFDTNSIKEEAAGASTGVEASGGNLGGNSNPTAHPHRAEMPGSIKEEIWPFQIIDEESKVSRKLEDGGGKDNNPTTGRKERRNFEAEDGGGGDEYLEYVNLVDLEPVPGSTVEAIIMASDSGEPDGGGRDTIWSYNPDPRHGNYTTRILTDPSPTTTAAGANDHGHPSKKATVVLKQNLDICYKTDDVLVVIAITCCLNFTFVLVIWACVRWFSVSGTKDLKEFQHLDCEGGGDSTLFPHETMDSCWVPGIHRSHRNRVLGPTRLTSTSLYTFRPDTVPQHLLRKSYSYSMEDLHFPSFT